MTPNDEWTKPPSKDAATGESNGWHMDMRETQREDLRVAAIGRKRALSAALSFACFVLPLVANASPGADGAKKQSSWRSEFNSFLPSPARAKAPAAAPPAPAPSMPVATDAPIASSRARAEQSAPVNAPVLPQVRTALTAQPSPKQEEAASPSLKAERDTQVNDAAKPVQPMAVPAPRVLPAPALRRAPDPLYAPPTASVDVVQPAPRQPGATKGADAQGVAAAVFSQWLDDKPDSEAALSAKPAMTEAQLRQRFHDAVRAAVERSPDVRQALAQWEATRYDVDNARGRRLPQVQLVGQSPTKTFGGPRANNFNDGAAVSVNVTTPVFDWGSASKAVKSNKQLAEAAEHGYRATQQSIALDVSSTLLELARYRRMTAVGDDYVKRMSALVDMLAQIVAADQGRRSEWVQARAQLLQATANRDASAAQARQYEIKLKILLGDDYRMNWAVDGAWPISPVDARSLLGQFHDHPAIRQAKATADAAELSAGAQRASKLPRVDWVVSKTAYQNAPGGMQQPWGTMLQVSWPLFSGGSDSAAYGAALARADASREQVEVLKRNYEYQVREAAQAALDAFARAEEYRRLSDETRKVRQAMFEQWYQLGKRSLLDVLVSETDHYNDMLGEISNRFDAYQAVFSAYEGAGMLMSWLGSG